MCAKRGNDVTTLREIRSSTSLAVIDNLYTAIICVSLSMFFVFETQCCRQNNCDELVLIPLIGAFLWASIM